MKSVLLRLIFLTLWVTLLTSAALPNVAQAQDLTQPNVQITGIDTNAYPEIELSVYGENLGIELADLPLIVREDKTERIPQSASVETIGIQTALVLDASNNILVDGAGNTGESGPKEFATAVETLLQRGTLSAETDWLGAFATGASDNQFRTIGDWTRDHGGLRNQVFVYTPQDDTPQTPLFDLIEYTLDQFVDSPAPANLQRSMIVFSDGFDATSDLDSKDIIRRAVDERVRVYTVMLGPSSPGRRSNLERIAKLTEGKFVFLDSIDALTPIWDDLAQQRNQLIIQYRTDIPQPQSLTIEAQLPERAPIVRTELFPATGARPAEIIVTTPLAQEIIELNAEAYDSGEAAAASRFLHIELQFEWTDGLARALQRVEYTINDETQIQEDGPFGEFDYPISDLPAGSYTLRVAAVDEAGLISQAVPVPFDVRVNVPPAPVVDEPLAAEPAPVTVPEPSGISLFSLLRIPLLLLLLFLAYRWWRKRKEDDAESSIFFDTEDVGQGVEPSSFTEYPTFGQSRNGLTAALNGHAADGLDAEATVIPGPPAFDAEPVAHLVCLTHGNHLPNRIPLLPHGKIRIGRSAQTCDIVLDDMRISRSHAYIMEKEDGFHILDDISTGGTFVNKRPLGVSGDRLLQDGDVINFHEVSYRFDVAKDQDMVHSQEPKFQPGNQRGRNVTIRNEPVTQSIAQDSVPNHAGVVNLADDDGQTEYPSAYDDTTSNNGTASNNGTTSNNDTIAINRNGNGIAA